MKLVMLPSWILAAVIVVVPVAIEFPAEVVKVNVKSLVALT